MPDMLVKLYKLPETNNLYKKLEDKLKLGQRKLSRKKLFSSNWYKQKAKVSKLQLKIKNA